MQQIFLIGAMVAFGVQGEISAVDMAIEWISSWIRFSEGEPLLLVVGYAAVGPILIQIPILAPGHRRV